MGDLKQHVLNVNFKELFGDTFLFPISDYNVEVLNPGGGIYKAENFVFSPFSSLHSWRSQVSHLIL